MQILWEENFRSLGYLIYKSIGKESEVESREEKNLDPTHCAHNTGLAIYSKIFPEYFIYHNFSLSDNNKAAFLEGSHVL